MSPTAEFFSQLLLLLIGIGFSAFYVPYITRTWEERRRELGVKTDLISEMSCSVMTFDTVVRQNAQATQAALRSAPSADGAAITSAKDGKTVTTAAREFDISRCVIGTELEAYFPQDGGCTIPQEWTRFTDLFLDFSKLPTSDSEGQYTEFAAALENLPLTETQRDQASAQAARFPELNRAWAVLEQLLLAEKLRLIIAVRQTPMPEMPATKA
jgi:hypothetical protein